MKKYNIRTNLIQVIKNLYNKASLWCIVVSRVTLPSLDVVQEVAVFLARVSPFCLEPILLLEQGVGDDELMLRTELQQQAPIFIVVANSVFTLDSFPQFEVSSHSCVEDC